MGTNGFRIPSNRQDAKESDLSADYADFRILNTKDTKIQKIPENPGRRGKRGYKIHGWKFSNVLPDTHRLCNTNCQRADDAASLLLELIEASADLSCFERTSAWGAEGG